MEIFHEMFQNRQDIASNFSIDEKEFEHLNVLFAYYSYENYSGEAFVLFQNPATGELFEVNGSHCSCYGLENQFNLEETTVEALQKRDTPFFNDVVKSMIEKNNLERSLSETVAKKPESNQRRFI